jgi:hypothetical protein
VLGDDLPQQLATAPARSMAKKHARRARHNIGWTHPEEVNKALLEFADQRDKKLAGS